MTGQVPDPTAIYHITHKANLRTILAENRLWSANAAEARKIPWRSIAHAHIRARRGERQVAKPPNGVLNDYVPWYFGPRAPMLLPLRDGRVAGYNEGQAPLIHLVTSVQSVEQAGRPWLFTDVHAVLAYATFFDEQAELIRIDWPLMKAKYWNQTAEDPDRPSRRQAEFLVHEFVPWACIEVIGVLNAEIKNEVTAAIGASNHKPKVEVRNDWYY